jgi:DsbC/DsbD-like thiol-disulfide interchange protein
MTTRIPRVIAASMLALVLAWGADAAHAQDASPWQGDSRSAVRLIGGSARTGDGADILRAGIEIKLRPGWKTYWRYPGDSGVPPRFDFAASDNVKSVSVLWPAPQRFFDGAGGASIGYGQDVILPLRIVAQRAAPVTLRLKLDYAVCEKLCVPVDASAELVLPRKKTAQDAALAAAEGRVPRRAGLGEGSALAVRSVRREANRVLVEVAGNAPLDLFAEGPSLDWALPLPQPVAGAPPGMQRFSFALEGLPAGATPAGAVLILTAVSGNEAIEVPAHLD